MGLHLIKFRWPWICHALCDGLQGFIIRGWGDKEKHPAEASLSLTQFPCQGSSGSSWPFGAFLDGDLWSCLGSFSCHWLVFISNFVFSLTLFCSQDHFSQGEPGHQLWVLYPRGEKGGGAQREAEGARARQGTPSQYVSRTCTFWFYLLLFSSVFDSHVL